MSTRLVKNVEIGATTARTESSRCLSRGPRVPAGTSDPTFPGKTLTERSSIAGPFVLASSGVFRVGCRRDLARADFEDFQIRRHGFHSRVPRQRKSLVFEIIANGFSGALRIPHSRARPYASTTSVYFGRLALMTRAFAESWGTEYDRSHVYCHGNSERRYLIVGNERGRQNSSLTMRLYVLYGHFVYSRYYSRARTLCKHLSLTEILFSVQTIRKLSLATLRSS